MPIGYSADCLMFKMKTDFVNSLYSVSSPCSSLHIVQKGNVRSNLRTGRYRKELEKKEGFGQDAGPIWDHWRVSIYCLPQSSRAMKIPSRDLPSSVKWYSTLGGTSGYTFLTNSPSVSISRNWAERVLSEMGSRAVLISEKRKCSPLRKVLYILSFHLPPKMDREASTLQWASGLFSQLMVDNLL